MRFSPAPLCLLLCSHAIVTAQGIGPDIIIGDLTGPQNYSTIVDGIKPFAWGLTSCNTGTEPIDWYDFGNPEPTLHPVATDNMYRMLNGRFEQLGQSWVFHEYCALQGAICSECEPVCFGCCDQLGVGCSDTHSPFRQGTQSALGPRWEINAASGEVLVWPYTIADGDTAIDSRLQVHVEDLEPSQNEGALYFAEKLTVAQDDAAAGNAANNASYRQIAISDGTLNASFIGATVRRSPAMVAWQDVDPQVVLTPIDVENDGRFILGYRATDNGDGTWHYEYALYNMYSDRSAKRFRVPLGDGVVVTDVGYHDVDYHTDPPYDDAEWTSAVTGDYVEWMAVDGDTNIDANALRWGTLYNFRFDADAPPVEVSAEIGLFKPLGTGDLVNVIALGPSAIGESLMIVSSEPPDGAIDARQPSDPDGSNPAGWDSIVLTFNDDASGTEAEDFSVSVDPAGPAPGITSVAVDGTNVTLQFDSSIPAGAWTTVSHVDSETSTRLGFLPADVNNDATSSASDVLALIDALNGQVVLADYQTDIDRSGASGAADVLRAVDLLNGANEYDPWQGASLPE